MDGSLKSVQTFGRKKTAVAVAYCKQVMINDNKSDGKI